MTPVLEAILHGLHHSGHLDEIPPSRVRTVAMYVQDALETRLGETPEGRAWAGAIVRRGAEEEARERAREFARGASC